MSEQDVKRVIVSLHKAGVSAQIIAKAFGISKHRVAALVAWEHPTLLARRKT